MNTVSKMTGLITLATASVGAALLFSAPANASASTLQQKCFGSNTKIVEHCCMTWTQSHGRPQWMWDTNSTCGTAVGCAAAAPKKTPFSSTQIRNKKVKNTCGIEIPTAVSHSSNTPPITVVTGHGPYGNVALHH